MGIGRVPLAVAKNEAVQANLHVAGHKIGLVQRLTGAQRTVADVLDKMPPAEKANTVKTMRSLDKQISAALGALDCGALSVTDCAEFIDGVAETGRARTAEALRSRLIALGRRGMQLGWMNSNPAEITAKPIVRVKRGRLTLDMFRAIHATADQVAEWLAPAMMLALVTGQDRSTITAMQRAHVANGYLTTWRSKTQDTNQPVAIPLTLRLDAVGVTLASLMAHRTGAVSKFIVHHVNPWGNAPTGSQVHPDRLSHAFTDARRLAGIPDVLPDGKGAPTFHEIRSLCKRLYTAQGNVDTKALLGHSTERMGALYGDPRGAEPIMVRVG